MPIVNSLAGIAANWPLEDSTTSAQEVARIDSCHEGAETAMMEDLHASETPVVSVAAAYRRSHRRRSLLPPAQHLHIVAQCHRGIRDHGTQEVDHRSNACGATHLDVGDGPQRVFDLTQAR